MARRLDSIGEEVTLRQLRKPVFPGEAHCSPGFVERIPGQSLRERNWFTTNKQPLAAEHQVSHCADCRARTPKESCVRRELQRGSRAELLAPIGLTGPLQIQKNEPPFSILENEVRGSAEAVAIQGGLNVLLHRMHPQLLLLQKPSEKLRTAPDRFSQQNEVMLVSWKQEERGVSRHGAFENLQSPLAWLLRRERAAPGRLGEHFMGNVPKEAVSGGNAGERARADSAEVRRP